jgi:predicted HAD superfamily Cof-like phosphohydrolase
MTCPDPTPREPRADHDRTYFVPPQQLTPGGPVHGGFAVTESTTAPCPVHGRHPHVGHGVVCLDCPTCRPPVDDSNPSLPARLAREFHEKFDLPIGDLSHEVNAFRAKLISEESGEVAEAIQLLNGVLAAVDRAAMPARLVDTMISDARAVLAKELADVVVAVYGTAVTAGIDLDAVRRVHASNLSKVGRDGRPILDADGKVQKGPNYRSPDMRPSVRSL